MVVYYFLSLRKRVYAMLLAFNIGNTSISFGLWSDDGGRLCFTADIAAHPARSADEYAVLFGQIFALHGCSNTDISGVILASVVPSLLDTVLAAVARLTPVRPAIVGPGLRSGILLRVDAPAQLGADLVALAAGARRRAKGPAVITALDTATTLSVLDQDGAFCGCMILPGVGSSAAALARDAAQLTEIALYPPPSHVIGRNTVDSLRAGLLWGAAAQIDSLVGRIAEELGVGESELTLLATGCYAGRVMPLCRRAHEICPTLLFEGLLELWRVNRH